MYIHIDTTKQAFLSAGFTAKDDPQFKFEYDITELTDTFEDHEYKPALLWDNIMSQFCVTDGEQMFIYFNATSPADAVEWASRITCFEPN